jgi:hypothetical protein
MVDENNNSESVKTTYSKLCEIEELNIKIPKYNCSYKWEIFSKVRVTEVSIPLSEKA